MLAQRVELTRLLSPSLSLSLVISQPLSHSLCVHVRESLLLKVCVCLSVPPSQRPSLSVFISVALTSPCRISIGESTCLTASIDRKDS